MHLHTLYTCAELINTCIKGYDKYIHLNPKKTPKTHSWIVLVPHTGVVCVGYVCVCTCTRVCLSACPKTVQILEVCETAVGLQGYQSCLGFIAHIQWVQKVFTHKCLDISSHKYSPNPGYKTFLQMTEKRNKRTA